LVVDAGMVFRVFGCVVSSSREIGHVLQTLAFGRNNFRRRACPVLLLDFCLCCLSIYMAVPLST
jgi:hypothetical protein